MNHLSQMKVIFLLILFTFHGFTQAQNLESLLYSGDKIKKLNERVDYFSSLFLGAPYSAGKLGEGKKGKYDKDPLYRFDRFDCTTFVETALSLALSFSENEFYEKINDIRYSDGEVSYVTRNHFTSLDWIPNNQLHLEDITGIIGGEEVKFAKAIISKKGWYQSKNIDSIEIKGLSERRKKRKLKSLKKKGEDFEDQEVTLSYIEISDVLDNDDIQSRLETGSIINIVRPNWDLKKYIGTNLNVSHQAILIRKNGLLYIRHAAVDKVVQDELFIEYFERFRNHKTVKGINILKPLW